MATKFTDQTAMESNSRRVVKVKQKPKPTQRNPVHRWAVAGVALTLALSGWLNGMAFSVSAPTPLCGWALGLSIPLLVLVFSRVSALLWESGRRHLAYAGAGATVSILLLSVQHCAVSVAALTGEHVALASLFALAVDAGLVVCDIATVTKKIR